VATQYCHHCGLTGAARGRRPVIVMASTTWLGVARKGWRGATLVAARPDDVARQRPRVLHLMGSPMETSTGIVMELTTATATQSSSQASSDLIRIEPSQLPLSDLSLIVVQGEPEPMDERRSADRERAAKLRAFGAELQAAGASTGRGRRRSHREATRPPLDRRSPSHAQRRPALA
jgi:hypothetical protein